jgi:hypothetical protein
MRRAWRSHAETWPIGRYLDVQLFAAGFAKHPKHVDVVPLLSSGLLKCRLGGVGLDDVLHDLLCLGDDVSGAAQPQSPDKCVEPDKF